MSFSVHVFFYVILFQMCSHRVVLASIPGPTGKGVSFLGLQENTQCTSRKVVAVIVVVGVVIAGVAIVVVKIVVVVVVVVVVVILLLLSCRVSFYTRNVDATGVLMEEEMMKNV